MNTANHELAIFTLATLIIVSIALNVFALGDWIKAKPVEVECSVQIVDSADLRHEIVGKGWINQ